MDVQLRIAAIHQDPLMEERLASGRFRINRELNQEWTDIVNQGQYVLNLQGRILACMRRYGTRSAPTGFECIKMAMLRSPGPIPLNPGEKLRVFTGEQPSSSTLIDDADRVNRVLWAIQQSYLWIPSGHEAHLYFSAQELRSRKSPLARLAYQ